MLFWCCSSSCREASTDGNTSPQTPTPCYFLSPNCFWSVFVCVNVYVCFHFFAREQRENSYVTKAGALWFAVLWEASALTSLTVISFSLFPCDSFPFSIRYDHAPCIILGIKNQEKIRRRQPAPSDLCHCVPCRWRVSRARGRFQHIHK